jgi:hypothetical protein
MRPVSGSISTNRGVAPALTIADTVGMAVFEVVITSSPAFTSRAWRASTRASVPLLTPTPWRTPQ